MTDQPNPATPPPGPDPATGVPDVGPGPTETTPEPTPTPTPTPAWAQPGPTPTPAPTWAQPGPTWAEPSLPAVEAADEAAPAQVVARDGGTSSDGTTTRRSSGVRWAIAIGGIAIVVGITIAILALTGGSRPTPSIAVGYMPSDTVQYGEYRLDLPGDQRQKLAAYLSKLPGFSDQSPIQPKLDDVFDRVLAAATNNR